MLQAGLKAYSMPPPATQKALLEQPVAAARAGVTCIDDRGLHVGKSNAALAVHQDAIPGVTDPSGDRRVPVADLGRGRRIRPLAYDTVGNDDGAVELHIPAFGFDTDNKGRTSSLPVAAERAASDHTGVEIVAE